MRNRGRGGAARAEESSDGAGGEMVVGTGVTMDYSAVDDRELTVSCSV